MPPSVLTYTRSYYSLLLPKHGFAKMEKCGIYILQPATRGPVRSFLELRGKCLYCRSGPKLLCTVGLQSKRASGRRIDLLPSCQNRFPFSGQEVEEVAEVEEVLSSPLCPHLVLRVHCFSPLKASSPCFWQQFALAVRHPHPSVPLQPWCFGPPVDKSSASCFLTGRAISIALAYR